MDRLVLFAKAPRSGRVKTRLVPPLDPGQALALYRAFVADQVSFLRSFAPGRELELCVDETWPDARRWAAGAVRLTLQGAGDLGERMERCIARAAEEGAERVVLFGADAPTLPSAVVEEAFACLGPAADAVAVPALDGGYVLIGTAGPCPALFRDLPWGGAGLMRATAERAELEGVRLRRLAPWYDVDVAADLARLRADLAGPAAAERAPATARTLAGMPE